MKKILLGMGVFWLLLWFSIADDTILITNIIQSIQQTNKNLTFQQQITNYQNYSTKIQNLSSLDIKTKAAFQTFLQAKIQEIKKTLQKTSLNGLSTPIVPLTNINIEKVKTTRLQRHNQERQSLKLKEYIYDTKLESTAIQRANYLRSINGTTHKRTSADRYYNYDTIINRFSSLGVNFNQGGGTLFSESIGRWIYSCTKADCTDDLIKAIKSTFKFFMSEKGKASQPHYKGIINKQFTKIGLGIAYNAASKKYFLVTHYSVDVQ